MREVDKLIVRLIGATHFYGVPKELLPELDGYHPDDTRSYLHQERHQDLGSDGARLIECAGRNCYDSYGSGRSSAEYHQHILEVANGSVTEHVSLNFWIGGISRGLTHELVRTRVGVAYSQRSTRYVDESKSPWIWHPLIHQYVEEMGDTELMVFLNGAMMECQQAYIDVVKALEPWLIDKGCDARSARKQARGAARGVLGNALSTAIVYTVNVRSLRNTVEQRLNELADAEIRLLFGELHRVAREVVPEYFNDYELRPAADGIGVHATTEHRKI